MVKTARKFKIRNKKIKNPFSRALENFRKQKNLSNYLFKESCYFNINFQILYTENKFKT